MKSKRLRRAGIALLAAVAMPAIAQVGHPAKGSWIGYWGTSEQDRNRMLLLLDWENRQLVGTINPGRNAVQVTRAEIDYDTWTMTIEAEMPKDDGSTALWVGQGKLENLGSWTNRRYTGTYRHGDETGRFALVLN
ncbi:MAG TPA: hypothetical protein VF339_00890 [Gammaproteobacteria bacterium]